MDRVDSGHVYRRAFYNSLAGRKLTAEAVTSRLYSVGMSPLDPPHSRAVPRSTTACVYRIIEDRILFSSSVSGEVHKSGEGLIRVWRCAAVVVGGGDSGRSAVTASPCGRTYPPRAAVLGARCAGDCVGNTFECQNWEYIEPYRLASGFGTSSAASDTGLVLEDQFLSPGARTLRFSEARGDRFKWTQVKNSPVNRLVMRIELGPSGPKPTASTAEPSALPDLAQHLLSNDLLEELSQKRLLYKQFGNRPRHRQYRPAAIDAAHSAVTVRKLATKTDGARTIAKRSRNTPRRSGGALWATRPRVRRHRRRARAHSAGSMSIDRNKLGSRMDVRKRSVTYRW
ncbi:hypothetical protein EVAR_77507_1 [Eumeta japonica]|uniref:Uncharacterized protein n=1 Tax=Eumeta variegata TaxID=151549 RepID=A0A4C1T7G5_EUMVA|nr:hypothetical protein EVAR_77507_1 [Eumeta japonica]